MQLHRYLWNTYPVQDSLISSRTSWLLFWGNHWMGEAHRYITCKEVSLWKMLKERMTKLLCETQIIGICRSTLRRLYDSFICLFSKQLLNICFGQCVKRRRCRKGLSLVQPAPLHWPLNHHQRAMVPGYGLLISHPSYLCPSFSTSCHFILHFPTFYVTLT